MDLDLAAEARKRKVILRRRRQPSGNVSVFGELLALKQGGRQGSRGKGGHFFPGGEMTDWISDSQVAPQKGRKGSSKETCFQALSMRSSLVHATWFFVPTQCCVLISPNFCAYLQSIAFRSSTVSLSPPFQPFSFLAMPILDVTLSLLEVVYSLWNVVSRLVIMPSHPAHAPCCPPARRAKFCSLIQPSLLYRVSECHYAVAAARKRVGSWRAGSSGRSPSSCSRDCQSLRSPALLLSQCNSFFCC